MRLLVAAAVWIGAVGAFDIVSFDGGLRAASVQWAHDQGRDVRYSVRNMVDKALGK
jgi:hypothetical protein